MEIPKRVYVIQQAQWGYTDEWHYTDGDNPIQVFVSHEMAEQRRRELENTTRNNLITCGNHSWGHDLVATFGAWDRITSLTLAEFEIKIQAFGLPGLSLYPDLPQYDDGSYENINSSMEYDSMEYDSIYTAFWDHGWWENAWTSLSREQVDVFWGLFDRLHFYEIVEVEVNP